MPWELTVLKLDGPPPRYGREIDPARRRPLGRCEEVRQIIDAAFPGMEWTQEPSTIESSRRLNLSIPESWDAETLHVASLPQWKGIFVCGRLYVEVYSLPDGADLDFMHVEVRGEGDPLPYLRQLCEPRQWTVVEIGKDGQCLNFEGNAGQRWQGFRDLVAFVVQLGRRDATKQGE